MREKLLKIIETFKGKRVLVVGDVMLDEYVFGNVHRISPEAPVPVVEVARENFLPGGAANVARNITAMGGECILCGVVGKDAAEKKLKHSLTKFKVNVSGLLQDASRPTTHKTRIMAHSQQVVRLDREKNHELPRVMIKKFTAFFPRVIKNVDAVCFSDYGKGMADAELISFLVKTCRKHGKILTCDPKPKNVYKFRGVTLVAPNEHEAFMAAGKPHEGKKDMDKIGRRLLKMLDCRCAIITRGEKGMAVYADGEKPEEIPALATDVYDVTGAGDTVMSALTLALAAGADFLSAVKISNAAAAISVRHVGAYAPTAKELADFVKR